MKCEYCGSELNENSKKCGYCGAPNPNYTDVVASSTNPIKENGTDNFNNSNVNSNYYNSSAQKNDTKVMAMIIGIMCVGIIILMIVFGIINKDKPKVSHKSIFSSSDDYVATYDGGEITQEEFAVYYVLYGDYLINLGEAEEDIIEEILYKEIEDEKIYNLAIKNGIKITSEQKQELDDYFNDEDVLSYFDEQIIDVNVVKDIYERDYYINNYVDSEIEKYTDEDVLDYIKTEYDNPDLYEYQTQIIYYESEQSAQSMLKNIKDGANFDEMTKFSEDEPTANENGKYICYDDGNTSDSFIQVVKKLDVGQLYDGIIDIDGGYCIVKLVDKVENGRANNLIDREDLFYSIFESENDFSDALYYESVAKEVIESLK